MIAFLKNPRYVFGLLAAGNLMAAGTAWMLEHLGSFPACRLCHMERLLCLLAGLASASTTWFFLCQGSRAGVSRLLGWCTCAVLLLGGGVALYHVGIQYQLWSAPGFCRLQNADSLADFLSLPSAECQQWTLVIGGIPGSVYVAAGFMVGAILGVYSLMTQPHHAPTLSRDKQ